MDDAAISQALEQAARRHGVAGAALGVLEGDRRRVFAFGSEGPGSGAPVTESTRFQIASVTKPMVATVVLDLGARGLLDLDDPVAKHVPELRDTEWGARATVRHLLASRSGVGLSVAREFDFRERGDDALALYSAAVSGAPPQSEPGSRWGYSNTGWSLLGRLVEAAHGSTWERAMRERLLEPLGMRGAEFATLGAEVSMAEHVVARPEGPTTISPWFRRALGPAGASLVATAGDLLGFAAPHARPDSEYAPMREPHASVPIAGYLRQWCLGWARFDWDGDLVVGWDGMGAAHRACLRVAPERSAALALLTNTSTGRAAARELFAAIAPEILGATPAPLVTAHVPGSAGDLTRYEGEYEWPDMRFEVRAAPSHLEVDASGATTVVRPVDDRTFFSEDPGPDPRPFTFEEFGADGRPGVLYHLLWAYPRT